MRKLIFASALLVSGMAFASVSSVNVSSTNTAPSTNKIAQDFNPGPYLGLQFGYGNFKFSEFLGTTFPDAGGFAGRIDAGYDFTKNFAVELGYSYLPKIRDNGANSGIVDIFIKGTMPIQTGLTLFAKIGPSFFHAYNLEDTGEIGGAFALGLGLGASYSINKNVNIDFDWNYYLPFVFGCKSINFVGVGVSYKFNG